MELQEGRLDSRPANKKNTLIWLALGVICVLAIVALFGSLGGWSVPASARKLQNPVPATGAALSEGQQDYAKHCKSCHGINGDGNGERASKLSTMPSDFTDARRMNDQTDGALFWKITHGRRPMPAFKDKLTDKERWELVDYIRRFAKKAAEQNAAQR
jgi:mono/diheme cytochrome c family protein